VLQNSSKLNVVEHAVFDGGLTVHVINVLVSEPVPYGCEELPESVLADDPHVFAVEATERVPDDFLGVSALEPFPEHCEEHSEVDWAGCLVHHVLQVLVGGVLAQRSQHVVEVLFVDEPVPVVVDHVEGFLELLDLILIEHGKDIASCSLSPLLGSPSAAGGLAR